MMKVRLFLIIFLPLVLATIALTFLIYYFEARYERSIIETQGQNNLVSAERIIADDFKTEISDLHVLATLQEVGLLVEDPDLSNKEPLTKEFLTFSVNKGLYDQIRFLDKNGMEIIRVNYKRGHPYSVPEDQLQFKGERYYFQETIQLEEGEVYVSPFDLNTEQGEVELPLKPMIRFGTPIFNSQGEKQGILVINCLAEHIIEDLKKLLSYELSQLFLINSDGYWLIGPSPEDEWGFMFEDKKDRKFKQAFPEAWENIKDRESGQFYTSEGLFAFKNIYPALEAQQATIAHHTDEAKDIPPGSEEYYWRVINYVSPEILSIQPLRILRRLLAIDGFLIVIISVIAWLLARAITRRRMAEKRIAELNEILKLINKILRHDISNDLTVVRNGIDLYQEKKSQSMIDNVAAAAKRSIKLIDRMRELESAISIDKELKPYQTRQVASEVKQKFPKMKIKIEGEGWAMADQALYSAIENSIRNAEMHGKTDRVDILIEEKGDIIEIRIADYGKGIPDEIKDKLFSEGFAYGETGHTGLGLYIMRKTIERYGGKVKIEDNKPRGAVFVLTLPRV